MIPVEDTLKDIPCITKQNLAVAWDVRGSVLDYRVARLQKTGELIRLRAGLYAVRRTWEKWQDRNEGGFLLEYLAGVIRAPSYVSLEYVLEREEIIPESPSAITCITLKTPRLYTTQIGTFIYHQVRDRCIFDEHEVHSYNNLEIAIASPSEALFDFLYLKPFRTESRMREYLLSSGRFNWDAVTSREKRRFATIVRKTGITKMKTVLRILDREGILCSNNS